MSNALVDNIGNASGSLTTPTQYVVRGSAKAWSNLNGTGTIALRDSLNVSSVVDNGTGNYTLNWSSSMVNANYSSLAMSNNSDAIIASSLLTAETSSDRIGTFNASFVLADSIKLTYSAYGDLA